MRYIKNILMVVASIFIVASCELDIEKAYLVTDDKFVAPILSAQESIIVNQENLKKDSVVFNYTRASFGPEVQVEYQLHGQYGENTALLSSSFSNSLTMTKEDFNGKVANELKVPKNETKEISSYIVAKVYGTTTINEVQSNTIAYNVTTFEAPLRWCFLPGAYFEWGTTAPKFWETAGGTNVFEILVDMKVATPGKSEFKVIAQDEQTWLGAEAIQPEWDKTQTKGNIFVTTTAASSIFLFSFNINSNSSNAGTVSKTDFTSVNIVGKFEDWGDKPVNLTYDAETNIWSSTAINFATADEGGLEFIIRLGTGWENKYGNGTEKSEVVGLTNGFNLLKGGANIAVPSVGTYIMKLHANRAPFVLIMEKQS